MIEIVFWQPSHFQNMNTSKNYSQLIKKKCLLIGRGQELQELEDKTHDIINLKDFDHHLSRVHASLMFSPGWFSKKELSNSGEKQQFKIPNYFYNFSQIWRKIPQNCLQQIWQFVKPSKKCILKDLNSKFGVYKSIKQEPIFEGMSISFGQSWILEVGIEKTFYSTQSFVQSLYQYQKANIKILGKVQRMCEIYNKSKQKNKINHFLRVRQLKSYQNIDKRQEGQKYLLLNENNTILWIGRGSNSDICLKSSSISRYQAYLKCQQNEWKICDGDRKSRSLNGTWKKVKMVQIKRKEMLNKQQQKQQYRIGLIKCQISIQDLPWINVNKILNQSNQDEETINFNNMSEINIQQNHQKKQVKRQNIIKKI